MQIAGVLAANAKDLVNPDWITGGKGQSGEAATAAAGAGAEAVFAGSFWSRYWRPQVVTVFLQETSQSFYYGRPTCCQ